MQAHTERYLDLVHRGKNDGWRYALGAFIIVFFWLGPGYLPYAWLGDAVTSYPLLDFVALNFSLLMMLAGLAVTVRWIHGRTLQSLVTPGARIDWARIGRGAAVWTLLAAIAAVAEHLMFPDRYYLSFDEQHFYYYAAAAAALTPVQCAVEELVFRGYVMQGLSLLTRRSTMIAFGSSVAFAVPHLLNPEVHQYGLLLMTLNYLAIGMVLAVVALRDGRLELAIGLHTSNNLFLALVANYEGSAITAASVFTARELDPWFSLVTLIAAGTAFYWCFFRRSAHRDGTGL